MPTQREEDDRALRAVLVALPAVGAVEATRALRRLVATAMRTGKPLEFDAVRAVFARQLERATLVVENATARAAAAGARRAAVTAGVAPPVGRPALRLSSSIWGARADEAAKAIVDAVEQIQTAQRGTWAAVDAVRRAGLQPTGLGPTAAMQQLQDAARAAIRTPGVPTTRAMAVARKRVLREIARLRTGEYVGSAREALSRIERAVRVGSEQAVADAVKWQTYHKQQTRIRQVADEERVAAFNRAYVQEARQYPGVVGFEWITEPGACERCEAVAGPTELIPPLHPHCRCHLSMIVAG